MLIPILSLKSYVSLLACHPRRRGLSATRGKTGCTSLWCRRLGCALAPLDASLWLGCHSALHRRQIEPNVRGAVSYTFATAHQRCVLEARLSRPGPYWSCSTKLCRLNKVRWYLPRTWLASNVLGAPELLSVKAGWSVRCQSDLANSCNHWANGLSGGLIRLTGERKDCHFMAFGKCTKLEKKVSRLHNGAYRTPHQ